MARSLARTGGVLCLLIALQPVPIGATSDLRATEPAPRNAQPAAPLTQENGDPFSGPGVQAHWNLTELIGSRASSFDSVAADVDGDREVEMIVSKDAQCEFYCLKSDGTVVWRTPLLSTHTPGYYGSQVLDLDGGGSLEFVAAADGIWVFEASTGVEKWTVPDIGGLPDEVPWTVGHVSAITSWDVVIARTAGDSFVVSVYDGTGQPVWSTAIPEATYGHTLTARDVDDDGFDEIFVPCSAKTVALDHDGQILWSAPLTPLPEGFSLEMFAGLGLPSPEGLDTVQGWMIHSDFAEVVDLYKAGRYYMLHDYGGGVLDPTIVQVVDARSGQVVDSFDSAGHLQWLEAADLRPDFPGKEIVYVTREKVAMRSSSLDLIWQEPLSGAHMLALGDWDGDGAADIMVSTVYRGVKRFAAVDSNLVVYNAAGDPIYNMLYQYPPGGGNYAAAQMQTAMKAVRDWDGDGRDEVPVCFSNNDVGKFGSSQDVHQYLMGSTGPAYANEFHQWANASTAVVTDTLFLDDALQLSFRRPAGEFDPDQDTVLLMHMNEGSGTSVGDSSPFGNNGILYHGQWEEQGQFGPALRFDGQNSVLGVPYDASLDSPAVTVEAWVNAERTGQTEFIVEKPGAYGLWLTGDDRLWFYIRDPMAQQWSIVQVSAPYAAFGRFAYIAASYDGVSLRLVVDGGLVAADSHRGAIDQTYHETRGLQIGTDRTETMPFRGVIDELRITSGARALARQSEGDWLSKEIAAPTPGTRFGMLTFRESLNGGWISYDLLDGQGRPVPGFTDIVTGPVSLGCLAGPVHVRANLVGGPDVYTSPAVNSLHISFSYCSFMPVVVQEGRLR